MCIVFLSHSWDQNVLLHVGAAGHRAHLRLDPRHIGGEEISDQSPDWRDPR